MGGPNDLARQAQQRAEIPRRAPFFQQSVIAGKEARGCRNALKNSTVRRRAADLRHHTAGTAWATQHSPLQYPLEHGPSSGVADQHATP